ncbi:MAG: PAS domain S-box protein [Polyangiaceae bacterium]
MTELQRRATSDDDPDAHGGGPFPSKCDALAVHDLTSPRIERTSNLDGSLRLLEFAPNPTAIARPSGDLVWMNDAFRQMLGWPQCAGEQGHTTNIWPELDAQFSSALAAFCSRERFGRLEVTFLTPIGRHIYAELSGVRLDVEGEPMVLVTATDVTVRKRAESDAQRASKELGRYFEHSPELFCTIDAEGRLLYVNPAWTRSLGLPEQAFLGHPYLEWIHPDDVERTRLVVEALHMGTSASTFENRFRHRDGSYRWVEWHAVGVVEAGLSYAFARDVTERHDAEARLRESEERFRTLFQLSPNPTAIVSLDGLRLVELNRAYARAVGSTRKALLEAKATCRFLCDPKILDSTDDPNSSGGRFDDVEAEYAKPGEPMRLYRLSGRLVQYLGEPHVMVSAYDVTKLRRAELLAARSRERLLRVSELAQIGHFSANIETGRAIWTTELLRILGHTTSNVPASLAQLRNLVIAEDVDRFELALDAAHRLGSGQHLEFRVRRPTGEVRHCLMIVEATGEEDDSDFQLHGLIQDLTDLKRAESDRRRLEQQVMQAQKLESLGVLAGGIAHDFNNLLTSILGNADLALSDLPSTSPVRVYLEDIETVSRRAADLCRQMLAYSGKGRFVIQSISLNLLVNEMVHLLSVSISKKAIIKYDLNDDLPPILADATQVRQVVMNLITNASEAIGNRSGIITLTSGAMDCDEKYLSTVVGDCGAHLPGQYVYLEVADTGVGMDRETIERIFDPFFTTKFTGRGLGLAAVLGIVRGHKGALKVTSEKGKGTKFRVLFPAHHDTAQQHEEKNARPDAWTGEGLVLLVDDEETIRSMGRHLLERAGFDVLTASDGREAIERFEKHRTEIVLVVLDMMMPHLDGEACYRELRRIDPDVKIIMTSGYNEQDVVSRFEGSPLAGFVQKPYKSGDLLPVIQSALRQT